MSLNEFKLFVDQNTPACEEYTNVELNSYQSGAVEFSISSARKKPGASRWSSRLIIFSLDPDQLDNLIKYLIRIKTGRNK